MIDLLRIDGSACTVSTERERALRGSIDLAISATQRSQEQKSAFQRLGIAYRRRSYVQPSSRAREWRKTGCDENRRDIVDANAARRNLQAHLLHDIRQHLGSENRLSAIASAVQPNYQSIANQRVLADTFNRSDLADPRSALGPFIGGNSRGREKKQYRDGSP